MGNHKQEKAKNHLEMSNDDYKHHKSGVYKTTILLSIVTIAEVAFAIWYDTHPEWPKSILRIVLVVMSLLKAGYIMAIFMHVKYEKKSLIATILLPFTLLIWMIIAFMMDGESWNNYRKDRFGEQKAPITHTDDAHHSNADDHSHSDEHTTEASHHH